VRLQSSSLINTFLIHPVAANLLMMIMLLSGCWALLHLNTQFLPNFSVNYISVSATWLGASTEDVASSITIPLEQELRNVDYVKEMISTSQIGGTNISLEFPRGTNMNTAIEQVKERVSLVNNLPADIKDLTIVKIENFERIARVLLTGTEDLQELRQLTYDLRRQLLDAGVSKVSIVGLPDQEMAIQVPIHRLAELHRSLNQIAERVAQRSQDLPAGTIGRAMSGQQLRSLDQRRSIQRFEQLVLVSDESGRLLRVGDIAKVVKRNQDDQVLVSYGDKPAVELTLFRTETTDALKAADVLHQWLLHVQPNLPKGIKVYVYDEGWRYIEERIQLLLKNGASGLVLILLLLFLLLHRRIAFWVAMGIPVSFMAALAVLYLIGGSINMISLFALIMTLGIIVDDTIVVGEEALTQMQYGKPIMQAVKNSTTKMLAPIMASSLTTIFSFLPLLLIGDVIGSILKAIPQVVICVIVASMIECFFVLPNHLYHAFKNVTVNNANGWKKIVDARFEHFRETSFRRFVKLSIEFRWVTVSVALGGMILAVGLLMGGRVHFSFFPSPDGSILIANMRFHAGTPSEDIQQFLKVLEKNLWAINQETSDPNNPIVQHVVSFQNQTLQKNSSQHGNQLASLLVEVAPPDNRLVTNKQLIEMWRSSVKEPVGLDSLVITATRAGPSGKDIDVQLTGEQAAILKNAALDLEQQLASYRGVSDIEDNLPYGQQQAIYSLTAEGDALGLTVEEVGKQLRAAFTGQLVQVFNEDNDEVEVRVMLPDDERNDLDTLDRLPIVNSNGDIAPLRSVVRLDFQRGFDVLGHTDGRLTVHVIAEVDSKVTNSNLILHDLQQKILPQLSERYGVETALMGKAEEQQETLTEMGYGVFLALILIYIVLAWVFASYGWPLLVMIAIPLGLIGAIFGHWVLRYDLTILSLFGLFGLSGIVINDSIILLVTYKQLREQQISIQQAIEDASCQRLRAVLLTSITTIAGLMPLLFETSLQAQFLIPMAISITFGLAFSTVLILVVVPALLSIYEGICSRSHLPSSS
jgi:multidrug efflux pump subunit AcrB